MFEQVWSKDILLRETLTDDDKLALDSLAHQPGFQVLVKLIDAAVCKTKDAVILVDPEKPEYPQRLAAAQQVARAMQEFSRRIRASVLYHTQPVKPIEEPIEDRLVRQLAQVKL